MNISIIIPNWNGEELLRKHLPAVMQAAGKSEVIVVDDLSTDDSVSMLKERFPQVKVIEKHKHEGFASTINAGVASASGDIMVLLNTDVEPEKNFLLPLLTHFEDPRVFAVGCMDKSIGEGKIVLRGRGIGRWRRGFYVHTRGEVDKSTTDWVSGGSGAFRKKIWEKLGGMDTSFNPFYWEDIDLSYRAVKVGYKLVFEKDSVVAHYHDEGKIKTKYSRFGIRMVASRNQFLFIWKNVDSIVTLASHMIWTPIVIARALFALDIAFILGYLAATFRLPLVIARRISPH